MICIIDIKIGKIKESKISNRGRNNAYIRNLMVRIVPCDIILRIANAIYDGAILDYDI